MIPITDRHLWEACRLAMEQDIANLDAEPCIHCFSENFRESIQQMQEETSQKHAAKSTILRILPLWRLLPAAAMVVLVCLAGYRLMELAPFRMGSSSPDCAQITESAGQDAGAGMDDTTEYAADTETAGAAEGSSGNPDAAAGEAAAESGETDMETPDISLEKKTDLEESADQEAAPESAENRTAASQEGENESGVKDNGTSDLVLLSAAYEASTRILELELRNDSARAVVLENSWMLFDADGETVNIETIDPEPSHPSRLAPDKTTVIRCILPDGELPEGEYTLDLDGGETILTFSFP